MRNFTHGRNGQERRGVGAEMLGAKRQGRKDGGETFVSRIIYKNPVQYELLFLTRNLTERKPPKSKYSQKYHCE